MDTPYIMRHIVSDKRLVEPLAFPGRLQAATQLKIRQTAFQHLSTLMQAFTLHLVRPVLLRFFRQKCRFTGLCKEVGFGFIRCGAEHLPDQLFSRLIKLLQGKRGPLAGKKGLEFYELLFEPVDIPVKNITPGQPCADSFRHRRPPLL